MTLNRASFLPAKTWLFGKDLLNMRKLVVTFAKLFGKSSMHMS